MRMKILSATALVSVIAVGCGPPSVEDVSSAVSKTVTVTANQAAATTTSVENMSQLSDLASGVTSFGARLPSGAIPPLRDFAQLPQKMLPSTLAQKLVPDHNSEPIQAQAAEIAQFLETRVFTEENVESREGDAVIFRITGEDICTDGTYEADPACVAQFDLFEVRLSAQKPNNSILVTLLLGPDRHAPISIQMSNEFVAFTWDLGAIRESILYASSIVGSDTSGLPEVMEGRIELRATKGAGEHDFTLSSSVLSAIRAEYTDAQGGFWGVTVAAGDEIQRLQFIEAEKRILAGLDLNAVTFSYPNTFSVYDETTGTSTSTVGQMNYNLGGASWAFDTKEGDVELLITNVGLGDTTTTLSLGSSPLVSVDVNPSAGRHFDLHVQRDLNGRPVFQIRSELDVRASLSLAPLRDHGQDVPAWADSDNMVVSFNGGTGGPTFRDEPYNELNGFPGGEHVLSGTLTLHTDEPGVTDVVAAAGQCLIQESTYDEFGNPVVGHPFAVEYKSVACP